MLRPSCFALLACCILAACRDEPEDTQESVPGELEVEIEQIGPSAFTARFTTEDATTATLAFWEDTASERPDDHHFVQDGEEPLGEHELTVLSLRPGSSYLAQVTATNGLGEAWTSEPLSLVPDSVLPLPSRSTESFDEVELSTTVYAPRPDLMADDRVVLTNLELLWDYQIAVAVAWDRRGHPVWSHVLTDETSGCTGDVDVSFLGESASPWLADNEGRGVLFGGGLPTGARQAEVGLNHEVLLEIAQQGSFMAEEHFQHHGFKKLDDGWLTISSIESEHGISDWLVRHDESFDPLGNDDLRQGVLWDLVVKEELGDFIYFANMFDYDEASDSYLYYVQTQDVLMGLDPDGGQPRWAFGPSVGEVSWGEDTVVIDEVEDPGGCGDPWFYGGHGIKVSQGEGEGEHERRVLVHDNGIEAYDTPVRPYTRAVEYRIDTEAGTAELLWCYPRQGAAAAQDALIYQNRIWGDIQRSGDNVFLFSGSPGLEVEGVPSASVVTELRPDLDGHRADLVWRMVLEIHGDNEALLVPGIYSGDVGMGLHGVVGEPDPSFSTDAEEEPVITQWSRLVE